MRRKQKCCNADLVELLRALHDRKPPLLLRAQAISGVVHVKYKCAHSDGKLSDFYLIEKNESELLYDVSLKATEQDAAELSQELIGVLESS